MSMRLAAKRREGGASPAGRRNAIQPGQLQTSDLRQRDGGMRGGVEEGGGVEMRRCTRAAVDEQSTALEGGGDVGVGLYHWHTT
jgi:hypothetical protein